MNQMGTRREDQRVAFVQFGDYLGAVERFSQGGDETYYAQRYSVELVENLRQAYAGVTVITVEANPHDRILPSGVRSIGISGKPSSRAVARKLIVALEDCSPTAVVLRFPSIKILKWCLRTGIRVLPALADSFQYQGLRGRIYTWRLAQCLNNTAIELVANHQTPASRNLINIGVEPSKIVAWDWPSPSSPSAHPVKTSVRVPGQISLLFAGKICEEKGVGDAIHAIAKLKQKGVAARAAIVGAGEIEHFKNLARDLDVQDDVEFTGLVPHKDVVNLMRANDVVVVPSRHAYGEGLPMTIFDALTSRTPLVVSDHPMFVSYVEENRAALFFHEKDAEGLAGRLRQLINDPSLYHALSENSEAAWSRLQIPLMWGELVSRWLSGKDEDLRWLSQFTFKHHAYL